MLRNFSFLFTMLVVFSSLCYCQTVDDIINANLNASGTKAKMDSIKSLKIVLNEKNISKNNLITYKVYTTWFKIPDKFKLEYTMQGKKIHFGFDGISVWGKNEFASNPIAGESRFKKSDNKDDLNDLKEYILKFKNGILPASFGIKKDSSIVEFAGVVDIDNKKYNKIKISFENSRFINFIYIDALTNLQYKFEVIDSDRPDYYKSENIISEYQKSDGIFVPKKVIYKFNGEITKESTFQVVNLNLKITDEFFNMPKDKESDD